MADLSLFLLPKSLFLSLNSEKEESVLEEILEHLKKDERVSDWNSLLSSILIPPPFPLSCNKKTVAMLYHGRTNSVRDFVMAVGRSHRGVSFNHVDELVHLFFVIAIPHALNQEYLRVMGSISRVCNDSSKLEKLILSLSPSEFIEILSEKEKGNDQLY
ncbi:MAG: PTS sugar transporter subunit IIA [Verrucomicrobia bacterium]|jgi:mannitol/fructose-specific phosphotransferase system IIA component (Ntr-type)|nr:MAG: PTS sugar transporter subunit IIA [Verrucomicrobiota bacterium]